MIIITKAREPDSRFIIPTFLDSLMKEWSAGPVPYDMWRKTMTSVAEHILFEGGSELLVARVKGEKNTKADLLGWSCVRHYPTGPPLVVYCYVKGLFRKGGIATQLLRAHGIDRAVDTFTYSLATKHTRKLRAKAPRAKFNPNRVRENATT